MIPGGDGHGGCHSLDQFMEYVREPKMYIVRATERCCCTCAYWSGIRAGGDNGFVYSLGGRDGTCKLAMDSEDALKYPSAVCDVWQFATEFA